MAAFAFFGGVPARLVPDNLKTGVDRPDLYDPKINRSYAELAAHYGCLVDPARAFRPADKPRVERPMPYVRDSSGAAGSSLRWRRCRPRRCAGAWGRRAAGVPAAGRRRPRRGVRRGREGRAAAAAGGSVRAGHLGEGEDRPGHPRPGRQGAVLGAVAAHRQDRRRPGHRRRWCSSSSAASWSRPTRARRGASRPTSATTYQLRGIKDRAAGVSATVWPVTGRRGRARRRVRGEVARAGPARAGVRVAADLGRPRARTPDDRRLCPRAGRVPGRLRAGERRPGHGQPRPRRGVRPRADQQAQPPRPQRRLDRLRRRAVERHDPAAARPGPPVL